MRRFIKGFVVGFGLCAIISILWQQRADHEPKSDPRGYSAERLNEPGVYSGKRGLALKETAQRSSAVSDEIISIPKRFLSYLHIVPINDDLQLTSEYCDFAGLSDEQRRSLQNVLRKYLEIARKADSQDIRMLKSEGSCTYFWIPGRENGEKSFMALKGQLEEILGSEMAEQFILNSSGVLSSITGALGTQPRVFRLRALSESDRKKYAPGNQYELDIRTLVSVNDALNNRNQPEVFFSNNPEIPLAAQKMETFSTIPDRFAHLIEGGQN